MNNNTRIRYRAVSEGMLESRRMFMTASGQEVKAVLDLTSKKYRIVDSATGQEVISGGNTRNQAVLKIQAKKGLMGLGVSFSEEKRDRGHENV